MTVRLFGWLPRLLLATVLVSLASSLVRPMLSYRTLGLGGDAADIGFIAAASGVLPLLVAVPVGRLVDRRGARSFVVGGLVVQAAATGLLVLTSRVWQLAVLNAVVGLGGVIHIVGAQALLATGNRVSDQDRRFGLAAVAVSAGQFIGPLLGGVVAERSGTVNDYPATTPSLLVATGVLVLGTAMVVKLPGLRVAAEPARSARSDGGNPSLTQVVRTPGFPQVIFAGVAVVVTVDLLAVYLPLLGEQRGISAGVVGALLAVRASASMASRFVVAPLVRRAGRRRLLVFSTLSSAGAILLILPLTGSVLALAVLLLLAGFFLGLCQPITQTWVVQLVVHQVRATALALRLTGNRAAGIAIPALAGLLASTAGAGGVIVLLGGLLAAASLAGLSAHQPAA